MSNTLNGYVYLYTYILLFLKMNQQSLNYLEILFDEQPNNFTILVDIYRTKLILEFD